MNKIHPNSWESTTHNMQWNYGTIQKYQYLVGGVLVHYSLLFMLFVLNSLVNTMVR